MKEVAITTVDNPFDPFKHFDEWYAYDEEHDYGTCAYLARIAKPSMALTDTEMLEEMERAIDDIIQNNPTKMYVKLVKNNESDQPFIEQYVKNMSEMAQKANNATIVGTDT